MGRTFSAGFNHAGYTRGMINYVREQIEDPELRGNKSIEDLEKKLRELQVEYMKYYHQCDWDEKQVLPEP